MSESCRYDLDRPYACQTHNTQWLDDDADQCEYKRMVVAEAAIQRVRDVCEVNAGEYGYAEGWSDAMDCVLQALAGEHDE